MIEKLNISWLYEMQTFSYSDSSHCMAVRLYTTYACTTNAMQNKLNRLHDVQIKALALALVGGGVGLGVVVRVSVEIGRASCRERV